MDARRLPRRITQLTRRNIFDYLTAERAAWSGRLDEVAFLSRLYDLKALESTDRRYSTAAGDIAQHRINNDDWDDDWVFYDSRFGLLTSPDEEFVRFLAEAVHPVVRSDLTETAKLLGFFNEALRPDGYELAESARLSGRPIYVGRERGSFHTAASTLALSERRLLTDPSVLHEHLERISAGLDADPPAAIASCKELVESLCKIILDRAGIEYGAGEDLPALYRRVADLLRLKAEAVPASAQGSESAQRVLRTLVTTVQSLAELRNALGLGHGRPTPSPALARHARLALNSTVAVTEFLLDTWQARVDSGDLQLPLS